MIQQCKDAADLGQNELYSVSGVLASIFSGFLTISINTYAHIGVHFRMIEKRE